MAINPDESIAPDPPYFAVILTAKAPDQTALPDDSAEHHVRRLAEGQTGYLGVETTVDAEGRETTVSFWTDLAAIEAWEKTVTQQEEKSPGQNAWFGRYQIRVCHIQDTMDYQKNTNKNPSPTGGSGP